jgi:hypothetical protein
MCPQCGRPNPTKKQGASPGKILVRAFGAIVVAIVALVMLAPAKRSADSSPETASAAPTVPPIEISAADLWRRYDSNEAAADNDFKGRPLHVSGVIASIDKDLFDHVIVALRGPNEFMPVRGTLASGATKEAGTLRKGQRIVLACTGGTRIVGSPTLDDCWF